MSVYVFTGPTLSAEAARAELDATYLPPAAQGDVFRVARMQPRAIGIIDGYFQHRAAVWHKEILWAMARGIHVFGSASMGALRAAELSPLGMVGVGDVFEAFRDGELEDDDEVAVAHGMEDSGYRSISEAMVNVRATLRQAAAEGVVGVSISKALEALAKGLFYPERCYPMILRRAEEAGLPKDALGRLREWLPGGAINAKRRDAVAMLRRMREHVSNGASPMQVDFKMEHTEFWYELMRTTAGTSDPTNATSGAVPTGRPVMEELRLSGTPYLQARDRALLRDFALAEARRKAHRSGEDADRREETRLRLQHGLESAGEADAWLERNQISAERFASLVKEEAVLAKVLGERDASESFLDHLRLSGRYAALRARADDKARRLREAGAAEPTLQSLGITVEELSRWYFNRLGPFVSPDLARHAKDFGFEDQSELLDAMLREYAYVRITENELPVGVRRER